MLLVFVSIFVMILIGLLGYLVWMDDQIYNPKYIPETEQEKKRYDAALRRKQLSLVLAGKMKADDATELKALFS